MKRMTWITLFLALSLVTAGAVGAEAPVFKIGVITSLSGGLATGGNVTKQGYEMWAKRVNDAGGIEINGKQYPVKLIYGDAQSEPSQAASAAERLAAQEKIDFALGPYSSGVTLAAAPVLEKYKIPMVTGSAESPLIWREKFKFTFGTIPPVNFTGSSALNVIATLDPPPKRAVVIGSNDAFSKATAETFRDTCEKLKIKVMKYDIVPSGQDLTPYMSAVRAMRPDVIAFGGHDEELIRLVKALRQIHYAPKALLMHYGVTEPAFIEALGKDAEQVYGASVWTPTLKTKGGLIWPDAQSYAADIKAAFGIVPDYTMAACSAAGLAFQAAVMQLGAAPPLDEAQKLALVDVLEKLDIHTFYGPIKFSHEGEFYHANTGLTPLAFRSRVARPLSSVRPTTRRHRRSTP
ncbi:amino acid ABC transporter substrate-binding protein [Desulfosarcina cetonica]|uniref:amino acid ABC transporter substrate-binding protein n=1 Tax=Desulfosarcina cetonica TaxID=90730 RepID=UPI0006D24C6F|nr:amino acid ABC transporter substrate-binding protein [Desulfosarcina cetonica]